ncbi:Panacea domain-containing protein [Methylobacterium sp. A49B]
MLVLHEREKLIQAIIFFAMNTRKLGKTKLYKLLYFLDFEHYKLTGRSVTGLNYNAWPMGPVPVALHEEITMPSEDLAKAITFGERIVAGDRAMLTIDPKIPFEDRHFSKREIRILHDLRDRYFNASADQMVEETHLENLPWHKVYEEQGKRQAPIPYDMALRPDEAEFMRQVVDDRKELLSRLG